MEKIIIFGGCGFLGSWIVKAFLKKGYSVSIFDLKIQKELLSHVVGEDINKIKFINGDITNYDQVQESINDMDHVINLAGLMTPDCSSNPILGAKVNLLGSINVFEALKKNNNKFLVYASSAGVFGQKDHYYPFPETHYGAYKLAVEGVARAYLNEDGISSVGIRPYVIYGPGREVGGTAGVTLACKAAKQEESYTINFSGKAGFVYVQDVVDLVEMSIAQIPSGALTFNINGITADVSEFINLIKKNIPLSDIGIEGDPLSVVDEIRGNEPSKTFKKFKYTSLEDGIKRTIDFY
ncbi:NAD(P)-dependent oxidoreductase [Alphaproteobacteria bacterium]|nr:NAD(P)-dependent oxidoreductase [Alphaproteobacteria bacterium]MDB2583390.1 NAD(P)-dependent oxidoreductase [Alphaproteobacteria bacterium]